MTDTGQPLVVLDKVSRSFDAGRIVALNNVNFVVHHGELIALCGPSGSGKSTLVNLLAGIDTPTSGTVTFDGHVNPGRHQWADLRATRTGIVFQDFNLLPTLTAVENVEIAMFGRIPRASARRQIAMDRLEQVGVAQCAGRLPQEMSGGERRRVSIARGLVNNPGLLLADEPTSNLDTATGYTVMELLLSLHQQGGMAMVIVTHDEAVMKRCPRCVFMQDGGIVKDSVAREVVLA